MAQDRTLHLHGDVTTWKRFPHYQRLPEDLPHNGSVMWMFTLEQAVEQTVVDMISGTVTIMWCHYNRQFLVFTEEDYGPNLAFGRPTYVHNANPTGYKYKSEKAVDGSPWTVISESLNCASYRRQSNNGGYLYFRVDLGRAHPISHVEITPPTDGKS